MESKRLRTKRTWSNRYGSEISGYTLENRSAFTLVKLVRDITTGRQYL